MIIITWYSTGINWYQVASTGVKWLCLVITAACMTDMCTTCHVHIMWVHTILRSHIGAGSGCPCAGSLARGSTARTGCL